MMNEKHAASHHPTCLLFIIPHSALITSPEVSL